MEKNDVVDEIMIEETVEYKTEKEFQTELKRINTLALSDLKKAIEFIEQKNLEFMVYITFNKNNSNHEFSTRTVFSNTFRIGNFLEVLRTLTEKIKEITIETHFTILKEMRKRGKK